MKRTRFLLLILIAVAMILGSVTVLSGQDEILISKNSLYSYTLDANNKATIVGYNGAETSVSINKIDGRYSVVAIGDGAFTDQTALLTVELSGNVTSIGDGAFAGCTALQTVRFTKKGLRTVGEDAFLGCTSLTELELPETVESIGKGAFYECSSYRFDLSTLPALKELGAYAFYRCGTTGDSFSVAIPDSLSEIGYNAFSGCSGIASFTVSGTHPTYTVFDGVLFADGGKALVLFPAAKATASPEYAVPDGTLSVAEGAFACSAIASVTLPDGLTDIGGSAFYECKSLRKINLPDSVRSIGSYAFSSCSALSEITIPDHTALGSGVFKYCSSLGKAVLPSDLAVLPDSTFDTCSSLVAITLPSGLTEIGQFAFYDCSALDTPVFPASLAKIGAYAFSGCSSFGEVLLPQVNEIGMFAFRSCSALKKADVSGLRKLSAYLFADCVLLNDLSFSASLEEIGAYAFYNCRELPAPAIPATVKAIGNLAFSGCNNDFFTEITVPATVAKLGTGVFYNTGVQTVYLLAGIEEIPANTFDSCQKLTKVVLSDSITSVGEAAFFGCVSLKELPVFSELKWVSAYAFYGCRELASFVIGSENTSVPAFAYRGCTSLTEIDLPARIERLEDGAFAECDEIASVRFGENPQLFYIGSNVFNNCNKLTSVDLPDSLRFIASYAFYQCSRLSSVAIPESVVYIGTDAFYDTPWLEDRQQENDFLIVGDGILLMYSGKKADITVPDGVKRIPDFAFYTPYTIESVTLPREIEVIATKAFVLLVTGTGSDGSTSASYRQRYLTLKGYAGTYAEQFAKRDYFKWVEIK